MKTNYIVLQVSSEGNSLLGKTDLHFEGEISRGKVPSCTELYYRVVQKLSRLVADEDRRREDQKLQREAAAKAGKQFAYVNPDRLIERLHKDPKLLGELEIEVVGVTRVEKV